MLCVAEPDSVNVLLCCCMQSEQSRATLEASPLYFNHEGMEPTPPRTARSTRSTSSAVRASLAQHPREHTSAARHAERLHTARQSGQYRGSGQGAACSTAAPGTGNAISQLFNKGLSKVGLMTHGHAGAATSR